ncbi:MAG: hypothetical protein H6922_00530 [Pseudomonadaceae bacterium]|nr:hypothetical protein [Pseudomonadaceae bacterium]
MKTPHLLLTVVAIAALKGALVHAEMGSELAYVKSCYRSGKTFLETSVFPANSSSLTPEMKQQLGKKLTDLCACQAIELAERGMQEDMLAYASLNDLPGTSGPSGLRTRIHDVLESEAVISRCGRMMGKSPSKGASSNSVPETPEHRTADIHYQYDQALMQTVIEKERKKPRSVLLEKFEAAPSSYATALQTATHLVKDISKAAGLEEGEAKVLTLLVATTIFHQKIQCCHGTYALDNAAIASLKTLSDKISKDFSVKKAIQDTLGKEDIQARSIFSAIPSLKTKALKARAKMLFQDDAPQYWMLDKTKEQETQLRLWIVKK